MSIEAEGVTGVVIATRNGVPPAASEVTPAWASDPPGGVPRIPDPDVAPHQAPTWTEPGGPDLPDNEPPLQPPHREAVRRSHHKAK